MNIYTQIHKTGCAPQRLVYAQPEDLAKRPRCEFARIFMKLAERRSYVDYYLRAPANGAHGVGGGDLQTSRNFCFDATFA